MNKKRMVAVMAAATMLLNVTPVMAANTASSDAVDVTGSGAVNSYDKTPLFKVTLPTGNALDFIVDPYGLLAISSGESLTLDELSNSGAIVSASDAAAMIKNESSVPVTVNVKLTGAGTGVNFKQKGSEVATGDATNMFLALIPSAVKGDKYQASGYAIPAGQSSATEAKFKLQNAKYEVVNTGNGYKMSLVSDAGNYDATTFKVSGYANPDADWKDVATSDDVALKVVFEYAQSKDTDVLDESKGVYGLVSGSSVTDDMGGSTASGAVSGTGLSASSDSGVDYEIANFSISSPYTLTITDGRTIDAVRNGASATAFDGTLSATIDKTNNTVTIPAKSFGAGAVNGVRYIKLKSTSGDLIIKLNCVA